MSQPMINEEKAQKIAINFMKDNLLSARYKQAPSFISQEADEYMLEFDDLDERTIPGVCIIGVNVNTGEARHVPVE